MNKCLFLLILWDHSFTGVDKGGTKFIPMEWSTQIALSLPWSAQTRQPAFLGETAYLPVFSGSQALWKVGVSPSVLFFLIASENSALCGASWYAALSGWISLLAKKKKKKVNWVASVWLFARILFSWTLYLFNCSIQHEWVPSYHIPNTEDTEIKSRSLPSETYQKYTWISALWAEKSLKFYEVRPLLFNS